MQKSWVSAEEESATTGGMKTPAQSSSVILPSTPPLYIHLTSLLISRICNLNIVFLLLS